jgi:hypothetical protein
LDYLGIPHGRAFAWPDLLTVNQYIRDYILVNGHMISVIGKPQSECLLLDVIRKHACVVSPTVGTNCLDDLLTNFMALTSSSSYYVGDDLIVDYTPRVGITVTDTIALIEHQYTFPMSLQDVPIQLFAYMASNGMCPTIT